MSDSSMTMKNLTSALVDVVDWKILGVNLGVKHFRLAEIERNHMGNSAYCKLSMLDAWQRSDLEASWEKLAGALEEMGEDKIAERVLEQYGAPRRGAKKPKQIPRGLDVSSRQAQGAAQLPVDQPMEVENQQQLNDAQALLRGKGKVEHLLEGLTNWNFDVNFASPAQRNQTLLHLAAQSGDLEGAKALVAFGARFNCRNSFNQTPLDIAQMFQFHDIAGFLTGLGAESGLGQSSEPPPMSLEAPPRPPGGYTVLSLDNTWETAILQLEVLHQIEEHTQRKVVDIFDWIVASGAGALLAMAMVYAGKSVPELKRIYFKLKESVFDGSKTANQRSDSLETFVRELLGTETRMCDLQYPHLLIGAARKKTTKMELCFFNNSLGDENSQVPIWKVARYTCTSPLSVTEADGYVDASAICSNLCGLALTRIEEFMEQQGSPAGVGCVVSVGQGSFASEPLGYVEARELLSAGARGVDADGVGMLRNLVSLYSSGAATLGEEISRSCQVHCRSRRALFYRFSPILKERSPLLEELSVGAVVDIVIQTIIQTLGKRFTELVLYLRSLSDASPSVSTRAALQFVT